MARPANLPEPLKVAGNVNQDWNRFLTSFEIYLGAIGEYDKTDEEVAELNASDKKKYLNSKGKLFLNIAGEEAIAPSLTFNLGADKFNYEKLMKKFEEFAIPKKTQTYNRFIFNRCKQKEGESFDTFLTEARKLIEDCEFGGGEMEDSLLRDRIVEGILANNLRTGLLRNAGLKLQDAIEDCKAVEQSKKYAKEIEIAQAPSSVQADATKFVKKPQKVIMKRLPFNTLQQNQNNRVVNKNFICKKCNYNHDYGKCPAFGKTCVKCKEKNHFQACCPKQTVRVHAVKTEDVNQEVDQEIENDPDIEAEYEEVLIDEDQYVYFSMDSIELYPEDSIQADVVTTNSAPKEYRQDLLLDGKKVNFKLDPGASASILPTSIFESLKLNVKLHPCKIIIKPYGKHTVPIPAKGYVSIRTSVPGQSEEISYVIADGAETPVFGIRDCELFGLIERKIKNLDAVEALTAVIGRARKCGVRFNPVKLQYRENSVRYVGHVFSAEGKRPCDQRVRDLMNLSCPKSMVELQSILGMFNYVREFIPNMSAVISNIRLLLKKGVSFQWTNVHTVELENLKKLASSAPEIVLETANGPAFQCIISSIRAGWPKSVLQTPDNVQPYWRVKNDLFFENGRLLLYDSTTVKVVVPAKGVRKDFVLEPGETVIVNCGQKKGETWEPGVVIRKLDQPRSYLIKNSCGNLVRRTLQHLDRSGSNTKIENHFELYRLDKTTATVIETGRPGLQENKPNVNKQATITRAEAKHDVDISYRLIVPDWLFKENVSRYGRALKPPIKYPL
ncbi:Transposon Tf2-6 polyprotein [Frankliniella fusca]|uniref:Transposon Tf2-6 polyprotein n=1 Tax=Frankliniella fusca TaxID=407009 RepID=A0AAE1HS36_9NEOP|nr:Transposon Tf2-6 polyprotein [Frankliniella fusca]